jgi:hypothetical protein
LKTWAIVLTVLLVTFHIARPLSSAAVVGPTGGAFVVWNEKPSSGRLASASYLGHACTLTRAPPRRTTRVAGSAAVQPSFRVPAHLCEAICARNASGSPDLPSTARMRSPGFRTPAAGVPLATDSTLFVALTWRTSPSENQ